LPLNDLETKRPSPARKSLLFERFHHRGACHKKPRYRGLVKNTAQRRTLFALANLVIVKKTLLVQA
jgi:hypothetical protein